MSDEIPPDKLERYKINAETGRLSWQALEKFFANGSLIHVDKSLDLVEVAFEFSQDNVAKTQAWLNSGALSKLPDDLAIQFQADNTEFWTVVVRPWVLIQATE